MKHNTLCSDAMCPTSIRLQSATTQLLPSFFLVSLLSETTQQVPLFPWKQQTIKNPCKVMFPPERQTPCWHYRLLSGLSTLPHSHPFPHFFISSEIKCKHVRGNACILKSFWRTPGHRTGPSDWLLAATQTIWILPQISKPWNRLPMDNIPRRAPLLLYCPQVGGCDSMLVVGSWTLHPEYSLQIQG